MGTKDRVSPDQVAVTHAVVRWYFATYYGQSHDMGMAATFANEATVGEFAVDKEAVEAGDPASLFKLFISVSMFQRLRDAIVMQTLRGISHQDADELTSLPSLLSLIDTSGCDHIRTNDSIKKRCDLTKDDSGQACCSVAPDAPCHLKRHSMLLRRYGHFGKVPSSAALAIRESGAANLGELKDYVIGCSGGNPMVAALELERVVSQTWRVASKIAAMFLSLVTAPGMGFRTVPWATGIDWTYYVVIDRNVDLFLESIGYSGSGTYEARRETVLALARQIDVSELCPGLPPFHPRLVQQAMFCFMSKSNRRLAAGDCSHHGKSCGGCAQSLRERCPVRPGPQVELGLM